jgi:hypothetical protein
MSGTNRVMDKNPYGLNNIVKVSLSTEDSARPADDPVSIRNETSTLGRAAFQDVQNMPYALQREFWFAHPDAQS